MHAFGHARLHKVALVGAALIIGVVSVGCGHGDGAKSAADSSPIVAAPNAQRASATEGTVAKSKPAVDLAAAKRPGGDRQIISTAQLDLEARNIDDAVQRATELATGARGYVFSESASLATGKHAHVVFKVVPDQFATVVRGIGRLGKLTHRQIATQDVTGQVVDLDARLAAAQTSAERLRQLLANSGGVGDLLNVEGQLTTREGQVDALSGQLGALRAQVDMATITLDVSPVTKRPAAVTAHHEKPGFTRGLRAGATAFANTARVVEAGAGLLLPFSPLALVALAAWWIARRKTSAAPGTS